MDDERYNEIVAQGALWEARQEAARELQLARILLVCFLLCTVLCVIGLAVRLP